MSFKEQLNGFYKNLDGKAEQIKDVLVKNGFKAEKKYYNGHYNKDASGNYVMDYYPIPVIEVEGLCDIEIVGIHINISTKTSIKNAIQLNYENLSEYYYEVYGVVDYLSDYYRSGEDIVKLYKNLEACKETEIGFGFSFVNNTTADKILSVAVVLKENGFYY
ncbi:MAG: hypothetical protein K2N23_00045 [Clostridia bacterium]|nr:hypothetical protein [Clostridia bacterium]